MDSNHAVVGLIIFVVLILGANFVMYAIARGWTRHNDARWITALKNSLSKPSDSSMNRSMDELRKQVEELQKQKKE